jgi:hypothetical protein
MPGPALRRRLSLAALVGLVAGGLSGCLTPSVPVPPPLPEKISFEVDADAGQARFSYREEPNFADAVVYVFNRDQGVGVITTAEPDGSVAPTEPFAAAAGDDIVVTFDLETQLASICVELAAGPSSPSRRCDL